MYERAFAVVCDSRYFCGLYSLLNSIYIYHGNDVPVFVYESGFSEYELKQLFAHPVDSQLFRVANLGHSVAGAWEAKQMVFADCLDRVETLILVDADVVLTSGLEDVFEFAQSGKIVAGLDVGDITYDERYHRYSERIIGVRHPYINSGLVGLNITKHWDIAGLWAYAARFVRYSPNWGYPMNFPGHGDQGILNPIIAMQGKQDEIHVLPSGIWHECQGDCHMTIKEESSDGKLIVWNENMNARQRILHSTGVKYWTREGEEVFRQHGQKFECYMHFAKWPGSRHTYVPWSVREKECLEMEKILEKLSTS